MTISASKIKVLPYNSVQLHDPATVTTALSAHRPAKAQSRTRAAMDGSVCENASAVAAPIEWPQRDIVDTMPNAVVVDGN